MSSQKTSSPEIEVVEIPGGGGSGSDGLESETIVPKIQPIHQNSTSSSNSGGSSSFPSNPLDPVPTLLRSVEGIHKLRRAIGKELISENSNEKCSNLPHLLSIVKTILEWNPGSNAPSAVLKPFNYIPKPPKSAAAAPKKFLTPEDLYIPPGTRKQKGSIRFIVDVVSAGGEEWFKVSARNPKSLLLLAKGGGGYGQKSILDHAKEYIKCASQNPCLYKPPKISFIFTCGIGSSLAERLEVLGITVRGTRIPDLDLPKAPRLKPYNELLLYESAEESSSSTSSSVSNSEDPGAEAGDIVHGSGGSSSEDGTKSSNQSASGDSNTNTKTNGIGSSAPIPITGSGAAGSGKSVPKNSSSVDIFSPPVSTSYLTSLQILRNPSMDGILKLNLDITALLAYVSNLTNGHTYCKFRSQYLKDQLEGEKERPQKRILDSLFRGRQLYCCSTAYKEFQSILETVGGTEEKLRSIEFLRRVQIVPDKMSERSRTLQVIGNVKLRSATIFGTGDYLEAVTVSANSGFVRSAKAQGLDFAVFLHESRALTEQKEIISKSYLFQGIPVNKMSGQGQEIKSC